MFSYLSVEEVLDQDTNDDFGISESNDGVDEGEGITAYLGKTETNTLELNFLAVLVNHKVEPPSASGRLDIERSGCESDYGRSVGECPLPKVIFINIQDTS